MQPKFLKTPALILRTLPQKEFDLEALVLTPEQGCLRVKALGARRPKAKLKCIGTVGSVAFLELVQGKHSYILKGARLTKNRQALAQDYTRFCCAMELILLASKNLKDQDPNPSIFDTLNRALDNLLTSANPILTSTAAHIQILSQLGLLAELNICTHCGKRISPDHIHLTPNGFACSACEQLEHTAEHTAKALYFFQKNPLTKTDCLKLNCQQTEALKLPLSFWQKALN